MSTNALLEPTAVTRTLIALIMLGRIPVGADLASSETDDNVQVGYVQLHTCSIAIAAHINSRYVCEAM